MSLSGDIICPGPTCTNTMCATWDSNGTEFAATCDPADCVCRSETITLQWSGLSLTPGAEVYLNLRVAEGALPEVQTEDDIAIVIAPCPEDECIGNLDGDLDVGPTDLATLLVAWGACQEPCTPGPSATCPADLDCDCDVGPIDLAILLVAWGPCL